MTKEVYPNSFSAKFDRLAVQLEERHGRALDRNGKILDWMMPREEHGVVKSAIRVAGLFAIVLPVLLPFNLARKADIAIVKNLAYITREIFPL